MIRQQSRQVIWIVAIMGLMWLIAACSSEVNKAYAMVAPASIDQGSQIPAPSGDPVLTVSGQIGVSNADGGLQFDMATLEKLGLVEYTIADPWNDGKETTYTGILLSDLLKYASASTGATNVHMVALDDYAVDVSVDEVNKWPVMLATRTDGEYMSIDNSGPTRIVFPFHAHPEIDEDTYKVLMIWNLRDIVIQ